MTAAVRRPPTLGFQFGPEWHTLSPASNLSDWPAHTVAEVLRRSGTSARRKQVKGLTSLYERLVPVTVQPGVIGVAFLVPVQGNHLPVAAVSIERHEAGADPAEFDTATIFSGVDLAEPTDTETLDTLAGPAHWIRALMIAGPTAGAAVVEHLAALWWFPHVSQLLSFSTAFQESEEAARYRETVKALAASAYLAPRPDDPTPTRSEEW